MSAGAQISWDEAPQKPQAIQWDDEQEKKPEEKPGVATRFAQSLLDNTVGTHTNEGVIEGVTKGLPQIAAHPLNSAGMILDSEAAARQHQLEEAAQHYQEPGIANKVSGFAHHLYGSVPFLGPALGGAADQFEKGDIAGGLGSSVGIAAMTHGGSPEVQENAALAVKAPVKAAAKFATAESNPHKLFHSYLDPVASTPHNVPPVPAPVLRAILRDMEAAGDGAAAARLKSGTATIGDLDTARQSANRLSSSIYRSPGNYSPGMAKGANDFAGRIRDDIYPAIESANGLPSGSLRGVKQLQGASMEAERHPSLVNKLVTKGVGTIGGGALGYEVGGYPGAVIGSVVGERIAQPIGQAAQRGIVGLRTKKLGMNLPEPAVAPPESLAGSRPPTIPNQNPIPGSIIPRSRKTYAESTADIRDAGPSEPIQEPNRASAQAAPGSETSVRVPGEDRSYSARYQVRELDDVHASHTADFRANPKYSLVNDRDYSNPVNQGKVISYATEGKFDPNYHITDNPDATNGPVVIDSEGNALGGNGRSMILHRVYNYSPRAAEAYKAALAQKASQFGIDPSTVAKMKRPVLVREIADSEFENPEQKQNAITDFNKAPTAQLTPSERAITDSRRISQATLDDIAGRIDEHGAEGTLADVLRGPKATGIVDRLINDGVITEQERAAIAGKNALTDAGKERISKLIVARYFRDPAQIDATPLSVRGKLEKVSAPLARVDGVKDWDLTPTIQQANDLLEEVRTHEGMSIDDLLRQRGLFGESKYSPDAVRMAKHLHESTGSELVKAARQYSQDAADAQRPLLLGEKITPRQAFDDAFGRK